MKQYFPQACLALCAILIFIIILGVVGDYDYCEQVVLHMSQEQYDSVKSYLTRVNGSAPSEREIAHWWVDHRQSPE